MTRQTNLPCPAPTVDRRTALRIAAGALLAPTAIARTAIAQTAGQLDGRRFDGVILQRGKTSGDADTLLFQGGRFRSTACDRYGYSDAPYRVMPSGDAMAFEAETESPRYGKLLWRGVIRGDQLNATATMVREGKPDLENWVVAATPR